MTKEIAENTNTITVSEGAFSYRAVPSRGVFCRLTCPEPINKVEYLPCFHSLYEAIHAGYIPCPVCQPDLYESRIKFGKEVSPIVNRAAELIDEGRLNGSNMRDFASELNVSERHLRRLFVQETGFSPSWLASCHRAIFAKRLLIESKMSVADVAYVSGFGSLRQFNHVFSTIYKTEPRSFRDKGAGKGPNNVLFLEYDKDFDYRDCLDHLAEYAIPGTMLVADGKLMKTFSINGAEGHLTVSDEPDMHRLRLEIAAGNRSCYLAVYHKIRRMFDLGRDETAIRKVIGEDSFYGYLKENPLPRLLLWFDTIECVHYAVMRQEMTHEDAIGTIGEYAMLRGTIRKDMPEGLDVIYPDRIGISREDQRVIGLSESAGETLRLLEHEIERNRFALAYNQSYRTFRRSAMNLTGMSEPSANYIAMFGLGMKNAYTYQSDWLISLNLEQWPNYRSYASLIYDQIEKERSK